MPEPTALRDVGACSKQCFMWGNIDESEGIEIDTPHRRDDTLS